MTSCMSIVFPQSLLAWDTVAETGSVRILAKCLYEMVFDEGGRLPGWQLVALALSELQ